MTALTLLLALARPLSALAVVLVVIGTVLPFATAQIDVLCGAGGGEGVATHCDACLPAATVPAPPAVSAPELVPGRTMAAMRAEDAQRPRRAVVWIRGPPAG